ncbi:alpha-N-arabinofuranosidase [Capsulimonas corticalis]|uniref:non-reducing end alpha-L-arabinofuranosidase n=1 Tax=Capsulimonas corticalis TaxID=2219043 RepID=A0A402CVH5_9BACT|nr:alpha-L-arabinofuranosidase C-terminal domain-containing protein [Capsulimonas corticalis]BDI30403.1 alpha-N-arabinofuranosidase [Capsulimonas corticalis]
MNNVTIAIQVDSPIGTISPRLYGHFAEHLGRCCYDGLWVGADCDAMPHENGVRADVLEALAAMPVPMLRWPGGCYADHYHWRDGVGPSESRPVRLGLSCGLQVQDDNSLGTDEFLTFCARIGAEPYLAGNMGSGTPQELCDWVEYCNSAVDTTLARERAANGAEKPYGVKLWGVGNENWGCGGNYDAETYAKEYIRYATMLQHVAPDIEMVACGQEDEWNKTLVKILKRIPSLVQHISIHQYWLKGGPETGFSDEQYYALIAEAAATEEFITRTEKIIRAEFGEDHKVGVALDEWGVWHPEARFWGDQGGATPREPITYEQAGTLRDALAAAVALEGFHRQCNILTLANLAQIVNVLHAPVMTEGARMWVTPTYHVLRMHAPHIGAQALPVEVQSPVTTPDGAPAVSATASRAANGSLAITLVNRHLSESATIVLPGLSNAAVPSAQILTANDPRAANGPETPNSIVPAPHAVEGDAESGWRIILPPHSVLSAVFSAE